MKEKEFWDNFTPEPNSGCWLWDRYCMPRTGYGRASVNGQLEYAHRLAWVFTYGPIPDGKSVLHKCDTPPCGNPDHLFLGTQADNLWDMTQKGRRAHKVTPFDETMIRYYAACGYSYHEISRRMGFSRPTIREYVRPR